MLFLLPRDAAAMTKVEHGLAQILWRAGCRCAGGLAT